jgi:hypothetical protein
MADALLPLQAALVMRLTGESPTRFTYPLHTGRAPQNAAYPYAVLGDDTAIDWGTKTEAGQEITVTIHSWSRKATSTVECKQMMAAIYAALHEAEFTVSGQDMVSCRFDFDQVIEDADGQTFHGVSRFRLFLSAA